MKSNILALKQRAASVSKKAALASTGVLASASVFAVDHTATINTAVTEGTANYTAVVLGVLGLAAVGFGVGFILSKLNK